MSRTGCVICAHKKAIEINDRLIDKSHTGESFQTIADHFGLSKTTLITHFNGNPEKNEPSHISELLSKSSNIQEVLSAESLTKQISEIREKIKSLLQRAEDADNLRDVHNFVGDTLKQIELEAKLQGQIKEQSININTQVNILQSPEWVSLRTKIVMALDPFPEAKAAVVNALDGKSTTMP